MGLIKRIRKLLPVTLALGMITMTMSGCAYANNKSWNNMTPEEQEEVRQAFDDVKNDLEASFSDIPEDDFSRYILDKVEYFIYTPLCVPN